MTSTDTLLQQAARGNADALDFLHKFLRLAHELDDVVDLPLDKERLLRCFMQSIVLFGTNTFYCENKTYLLPLVLMALDGYANSVEWEDSEEDHKVKLADVLRSAGMPVVSFVALLCAGGNVDVMRELSPQLQMDSWDKHHDKEGKPI